ncbi:MAG: 30S ribosome-binding factor RbfA [Acidobacteriota bacterium]|jgi:ribosome-binding factor A|nr:30S ribosome-binding factor RbfA [Acidobacteriota bacterium]NLT33676.1 30S ribosome-binding factor RbfA [Acidobacteriota bacterium]
MQPSRRPQRLGLQIQHEISLMLSRNMKDRRIGFVTVTGVTLTPDLKHARVFISTMGSKEEKTVSLKTLNHATGWIRRELGQRIRTRFVPELTFLIDNSQEYGERIDRLLDEIHGKDNE